MDRTEPTNYALYLKEIENIESVEYKEGFFNYLLVDMDGCKSMYIRELYVRPEHRLSGIAYKMGQEIITIANKNDCKLLTCTVGQHIPSKHSIISGYEKWGFIVTKETPEIIYMAKEL